MRMCRRQLALPLFIRLARANPNWDYRKSVPPTKQRMKKTRPCIRKDEIERFTPVFGKCLKVATETRIVRAWPPGRKKFRTLYLCANCAVVFDEMVSEYVAESALS